MPNPKWTDPGDVPASKDMMKKIIENQDSDNATEVGLGETFWDPAERGGAGG